MIEVKICGLNDPASVVAAAAAGAGFVGFIFYPPSPRAVTPVAAAQLARLLPSRVLTVGLFVDPADALLESVLALAPLEMLQLHGGEPPERVAQIKARFGRPVMKAIAIAEASDLAVAQPYLATADWLLFDAKPPPEPAALPGGNARPFDWRLLAGRQWARPWMLSGGLTADNLAQAVRESGATVVDVSSGVEDRPGVKNPDRIRAFLETAAAL
jgi:phosphoribosylanthranilate isomerase